MSSRNRFGCLSALLLVALCASLLVNFMLVGSRAARALPGPSLSEEVVVPPKDSANDRAKIALIPLRGIITSSEMGSMGESMVEEVKLQLRLALEDSKVKAIVLNVDSPGGEVTASDIIYQAVRQAREKKPVVVYMGSLAASGGYYISCGGSYLMANETTLTGSIGVIMQALQYKGLMEKVGVDVITFKSGKFKDMLSGSREPTDEEKEYVQKLVMQTYDKFVGIVASERKQDEAALRNGLADGRVISGRDALAAKLIDGVGSIEDAYTKALELGHVSDATVIKYESTFKLGHLLKFLALADHRADARVEVNLMEGLKPKLEVGRLYYLPSFLAP